MASQKVVRKFPFNLSVGNDICHVDRIRRLLASKLGHRFVQKILTVEEMDRPEIQHFLNSKSSAESFNKELLQQMVFSEEKQQPDNLERYLADTAIFLAGRFAAKEAAMKAHPDRNLTWHQIVIKSQVNSPMDKSGPPKAIIKGETEDVEALISISHDGAYATAVCLGAPGSDTGTNNADTHS